MNTRLIPGVRQLSFVGDSRVKIFDGRVLATNAGGEIVATSARWTPFLRAAEFFRSGTFGRDVSRALWEMRFLEAQDCGHPAFGTVRMRTVLEGDRDLLLMPQASERLLVVSCGVIDTLELEQEIAGKYWFELEAPCDYDTSRVAAYRAPTQLGYHVVYEELRRKLGPLFAGLSTLKEAGIARVHVMGLSPPSIVGNPSDELRLRLFETGNRIYRDECEAMGLGFLDVWALSSAQGVRNEDYFRGELHHTEKFVPVVVSRLLEA